MGGTKDEQRWRSHNGAEVSSGGGEAWRSQWRRRGELRRGRGVEEPVATPVWAGRESSSLPGGGSGAGVPPAALSLPGGGSGAGVPPAALSLPGGSTS
jgi:hypothetical protein